jgi:multidrug efflux pump subunit AcrB
MVCEAHMNAPKTKRLSSLIDGILSETLSRAQLSNNAARERARQDALVSEEDDDVEEKSSEEKPSKTVDAEKEKLRSGDVSSDDIVSKLNTLRAGRSFKDEDIAARLNEYVKSLTKAERVALLAFLKGLAQIVTGEIPAEDAVDPGDKPADVDMKKKSSSQTVTIKPTVVKSTVGSAKKSSEDTTAPIKVKK